MTTLFTDLPVQAQYALLRPHAFQFAKELDLAPKTLQLIQYGYNATYKLTNHDNQIFALKIILESPRTLPNLHAEIKWCHSLARQGIPVSKPISLKIPSAELPGFPKPIYALCCHWLPGRQFSSNPNADQLKKVSLLTKSLHDNPPILSQGESFPEFRETLAGAPCQLKNPIILDTIAECNEVINKVWQKQPSTCVHFDLHSWNLRYNKGIAYAFDFEFAHSAPPLLDIAALIFCHRFSKNAPETDTPLWSAFKYRPSDFGISNRDFELLILGRKILLVNDIFVLQNPLLIAGRDENLKRTLQLVEHFHKTGKYDPSIPK